MNVYTLSNVIINIRCNTEVDQVFKVLGDLVYACDQDFTGNMVDATFNIKMHIRLYDSGFRVISERH